MRTHVEFFGCATKWLSTIVALVLLSLQLLAQQPCGVNVRIIPIRPVVLCHYNVIFENSRMDVRSVRFEPIDSSTRIRSA
jgi:hypothetical protein